MKRCRLLAVVILGSVLFTTTLPTAAQAASNPLRLQVAVVTDYVFRGISRSDNDPAAQAGLEYLHASGAYAGIWGSSVDTPKDSDIELDVYAGYAAEIPAWHLGRDLGLISYRHNESRDNRNEWYVGASFDPWPGRLTLVTKLSHDWDSDNRFIEALGKIGLGGGVWLHLQPGYGDIRETVDGVNEDYSYLRIGVAKGFAFQHWIRALEAEVSYSDTDIRPGADAYDDLWWLSLKAHF